MIKRCPLVAHAIVGERLQELDDLRAVLLAQTDISDSGTEVAAGGNVPIPRIELQDLFERCGAAGMEVRTRELHVAEIRCLERADGAAAWCGRKQRRSERIHACSAGIVLDRADANSEQAERAWVRWITGCRRADAGRRQLRSLMALRALRAAVSKLIQTLLLDGSQRGRVAREESIRRRVVAYQRRFVGLNGNAKEESEVVRHLRELARS